MKYKVGDLVILPETSHRYRILRVLDNTGYEVRNEYTERSFNILIGSGDSLRAFEEDCVLEEVYNSPLYQALR